MSKVDVDEHPCCARSREAGTHCALVSLLGLCRMIFPFSLLKSRRKMAVVAAAAEGGRDDSFLEWPGGARCTGRSSYTDSWRQTVVAFSRYSVKLITSCAKLVWRIETFYAGIRRDFVLLKLSTHQKHNCATALAAREG